MRIGVLALQGAFREHMMTLEALGAVSVAVRQPDQMGDLNGLIIPGGESSAIAKLMHSYGFYDAIRQQHGAGMAIWGTCAGAILMARAILDALPGQESLNLMDIDVRRNAYGRQVDSFEADLDFRHLSGGVYRGVFIRAPWIERVGDDVEVLAEHDGRIVAARQGSMMATTFHPELTGDPRVHRYFLDEVVGG
ncbi:MAG: pyridoxal 5'-phosphate synthase glutaminase subunit PdxT [Coriobacteriia bacterium]